jgi:hypothetical protein
VVTATDSSTSQGGASFSNRDSAAHRPESLAQEARESRRENDAEPDRLHHIQGATSVTDSLSSPERRVLFSQLRGADPSLAKERDRAHGVKWIACRSAQNRKKGDHT